MHIHGTRKQYETTKSACVYMAVPCLRELLDLARFRSQHKSLFFCTEQGPSNKGEKLGHRRTFQALILKRHTFTRQFLNSNAMTHDQG